MAKVYTLGQMAGNMKGSTLMIRKKGTVFILGLMDASTRDSGLKATSMVRAGSLTRKAKSRLVFGSMVSSLNT